MNYPFRVNPDGSIEAQTAEAALDLARTFQRHRQPPPVAAPTATPPAPKRRQHVADKPAPPRPKASQKPAVVVTPTMQVLLDAMRAGQKGREWTLAEMAKAKGGSPKAISTLVTGMHRRGLIVHGQAGSRSGIWRLADDVPEGE